MFIAEYQILRYLYYSIYNINVDAVYVVFTAVKYIIGQEVYWANLDGM